MLTTKSGYMAEIECSLLRGHDGPHAYRDPETGEVIIRWFRESLDPPPPQEKPKLKIDRITRNFRPRKKEEILW